MTVMTTFPNLLNYLIGRFDSWRDISDDGPKMSFLGLRSGLETTIASGTCTVRGKAGELIDSQQNRAFALPKQIHFQKTFLTWSIVLLFRTKIGKAVLMFPTTIDCKFKI